MSTLVVDFGGTVIKMGRAENGKIVARDQIEGRSLEGCAQALARTAVALRALRTDSVTGVAFAVPTLVDVRKGRVLNEFKGKYEGIKATDFNAWSAKEFGLPIRVENDAHAALLGEWRFGAGVGCQDMVMITLGTGIGTSALIGGKALRGAHCLAGNMAGHYVLDPNGFECICGLRGCIEAQQSVSAVRSLAEADPRFASSALASAAKFDYATLFSLRGSDPLARDLTERSLGIWASLAASLMHLYDPSRIVVGGGILRSKDVILPRMQAFADRAGTQGHRITVVAAALGDDAALLGLDSLMTDTPEFI